MPDPRPLGMVPLPYAVGRPYGVTHMPSGGHMGEWRGPYVYAVEALILVTSLRAYPCVRCQSLPDT